MASEPHWFIMNNDGETSRTFTDLKSKATNRLDEELRVVGDGIDIMDIQFGAAVPADVDNNRGGGNEMAQQDVVKVLVDIANKLKLFNINGGTIREKHSDQELLRKFVKQGEARYAKYRQYFDLHDAIAGYNSMIVSDGNFKVAPHGRIALSILDKDINVTVAEKDNMTHIVMRIRIVNSRNDSQHLVTVHHKFRVDTSMTRCALFSKRYHQTC
eukprot:GHVS01097946.1.p1 GENE.GHVS01097946.1~~GHVS01097946.1.p1  ORF type:complete len:214 (+),score=11.61 GHVS01097946.1:207-848(+)